MQKRIPLRVRRAALGINQWDTSDASGLARDRYWRIENGVADPTPAEQKRIAKALKSTVADLFGHEQVTA